MLLIGKAYDDRKERSIPMNGDCVTHCYFFSASGEYLEKALVGACVLLPLKWIC